MLPTVIRGLSEPNGSWKTRVMPAADITHVSGIRGKNIGVIKDDFARCCGYQAKDASCDGGFAAAAFTDKAERRRRFDRKRNAIDGLYIADGAPQQSLLDRKIGLEVVNL